MAARHLFPYISFAHWDRTRLSVLLSNTDTIRFLAVQAGIPSLYEEHWINWNEYNWIRIMRITFATHNNN